MAEVVLEGVTKIYGDGTRAVNGLDLSIGDAEFLVLVGPSGCGKSTALRMVAGLERISAGTVTIGERVVNDLPPKDRDIAMVFQNYALYPHMTVRDNIGFGLRLRKIPKDQVNSRVDEAARILELSEFLDRKPRALSGGQRQRVAMGRAIVRDPQAFLMDEPLSNLDAKLRVQMRSEIARIQHDLGTTTIYVTHDQVEAMTMGDRVAVVRKGELQQVDAPQVLYDRPVNLFVAGFIGSPAMNLVEASFEEGNGKGWVSFGSNRLELPEKVLTERPALRSFIGRRVVVGIRPEDMEDGSLTSDAPKTRRIPAEIELSEAMGSEVYVHFAVDAPPVLTEDTKELAEDVGEAAEEKLRAARSVFVARFSPRSKARKGEPVDVAVDTARFHFFDPVSGRAIYDDAGAV